MYKDLKNKMSPRERLDYENKHWDWFTVAIYIGLPLLLIAGFTVALIENGYI